MGFNDDNQALPQLCAEKFQKIMKMQSSTISEDKMSGQQILSLFDKMFSNDGVECDTSSSLPNEDLNQDQEENDDNRWHDQEQHEESLADFHIQQLDGQDDSIIKGKIPSCLFAVQCEIPNVVTWINFFRSWNFLCGQTNYHPLCSFKKNEEFHLSCFFLSSEKYLHTFKQ